MKIQIFDPEMCCTSGVCGTAPDPTLIEVNGLVERLKAEGASVSRYQLSRQPHAFTATPAVYQLLLKRGTQALPAVMVDEVLVAAGAYPTYEQIQARQPVAAAVPVAGAINAATSSAEHDTDPAAEDGGCNCGSSGCC
jgi:hypothetical protein